MEADEDFKFVELPPEVYKGELIQFLAEKTQAFASFLFNLTLPYVRMYSVEFKDEENDNE